VISVLGKIIKLLSEHHEIQNVVGKVGIQGTFWGIAVVGLTGGGGARFSLLPGR
jgi:hypothetical protein